MVVNEPVVALRNGCFPQRQPMNNPRTGFMHPPLGEGCHHTPGPGPDAGELGRIAQMRSVLS